MSIKRFDRYELKYIITHQQYESMVKAIAPFMEADMQGGEFGRYTITSLYYDTVDYKAYWDKLEGHRFRRKVRVRVYGDEPVTPQTLCFVEIKQRINKTLQKKRVILPYQEAVALCGAGQAITTDSAVDQAVIDEIRYLYYTLQLQPACIVSYQRLAFNGIEYDPGLRVTFDSQLKGRSHNLSLLTADQGESQFFVPPGWYILEVKVNYRIPYWLTELINDHHCTLRRISKYCVALEQTKSLLQTQQFTY